MTNWIVQEFHAHWHGWLASLVILSAALLLSGYTLPLWVHTLARIRRFRDSGHAHLLELARKVRRPTQLLFMLTVVGFVHPFFGIPQQDMDILRRVLGVLWFAALGWFMISMVGIVEDLFILRFDISVSDNLNARRARTQIQLLKRIFIIFLVAVDAGLILSVFRDSFIWHFGAGILASAGLASLVLATAAKSSASNLLAGLQIAITEPIRLDDVVIVEGEWGRIEEITTTYVIVAIWDERRLIVPLSYFIENPFQNWTRSSAHLLGTAFLYLDYSVPIEPLREEFRRILEESKQWDKRVCALQVTDLSEHTMQVRCLLSCANSSDQFDLRCIVREKMLAFIQKNYPDTYPRARVAMVAGPQRQDASNRSSAPLPVR